MLKLLPFRYSDFGVADGSAFGSVLRDSEDGAIGYGLVVGLGGGVC